MMESTIDGRLEELRSLVLELREIVLRQSDEMRRELRELPFPRSVAGTAEDPATASYHAAIRRIRELVSAALPREATVAVVSRGDDQLLDLYGRRAWHFPRMDDGTYAGYHPADSHAAIAQLEASRQRGAEYLLVPRTAFWWFDHYPALHRHLERRYDAVLEADECTIYSLRARPVPGGAQGARPLAEVVDRAAHRLGRAPAVLDLTPGSSLAGTLSDRTVFTPPSRELPLPYLDRTIDLVVVGEGDDALLAEAWRVAETAVVDYKMTIRCFKMFMSH